MDEGMNDTERQKLREIVAIAEDHIDYAPDEWGVVLKLAREALGEGA